MDSADPRKKVFSTQDVPPEHRLDYWLGVVCSLYCRLDCQPPDDASVFGRIESRRVGDLGLSRVRSNGLRVWHPRERACDSGGGHVQVVVQHQGRGLLLQEGREAPLEPGDFALHDCAEPYELRFEGGLHEVTVVRLPRGLLARHIANLEDLTAMAVPGRGAAGRLLLSMIETLAGDADALHPSSAHAVCEGVTSIIAAGLRSVPGANVRKYSSLAAYHLERIKAHVRTHLRNPALSLASIAAAVGLSPDHVSRLFRAEPMPLSRLIWQWRLDGCRSDLADPRLAARSVTEIAFSWGFSSAAHFSRCFREQHGVTPREWRRQR